MHKDDGLILSLGQFNQWVSDQVTSSGVVQLWPGMPVSEPIIESTAEGEAVGGIRLADQGVGLDGMPSEGFMPGMDVRAALTVVADGPVGAVGRQLDAHFGLPAGNHQREWALGMKMVVELREDSGLKPGTVLHTLGFPEPEIFGFLYVHPERLASVGIFIPSWLRSPVRTAYRYLQHFMLHPYLWRHLEGGTLKSWGAKSLQESGRQGEPFLAGNGYARIGEGSGSTNVLAGSGVDEAWTTGVQLAEAVVELLEQKKPFTRENLEQTYVRRRRGSWVDEESKIAADSRNGFEKGVVTGLIGMALAGVTRGAISVAARKRPVPQSTAALEAIYEGRIPAAELKQMQEECAGRGTSLHDRIMDRCGWPEIPFDGRLLISHQDALLMGAACRRRRAMPITWSFSIPSTVKAASRNCAWKCAPGRRSRAAKAACRPSTARSVYTAALACGTAAPAPTEKRGTLNSVPELEVCIPHSIDRMQGFEVARLQGFKDSGLLNFETLKP